MKKLIATIMAVCMLCGMSALADNQTVTPENSATPKTVLTVTLDESYTVVIPATLNIPNNAASTNLPVEVTSLRLLPHGLFSDTFVRKLAVSILDSNGMVANASYTGTLSSADTSSTIEYSIGGSETSGSKGLLFTECGTKNFQINIASDEWSNASAGSYTSTLSFYVDISDYER